MSLFWPVLPSVLMIIAVFLSHDAYKDFKKQTAKAIELADYINEMFDECTQIEAAKRLKERGIIYEND